MEPMRPIRRAAQAGLASGLALATTPLKRWVISVLAHDRRSGIDYDAPRGDAGLFDPQSVTWIVHADFPGMMSGGICALMLQTLHPQALAGVWDHSNFREDLLGRLRRTTAFVAGTTFAPRSEADKLIARVRAIHGRVNGTTADGRAYSANDAELLTWVHCTEMWSFLRGYEVYRPARLSTAVKDRYFAETARVAEQLGARGVPKSQAEIDAYFSAIRPQLEFSERSRVVLEVLNRVQLPIPAAGVSRHLFLGAGAALLPDWARQLMPRSPLLQARDRAARETLRRLGPLLRAALREGVAARSCRRVGISPQTLQRIPD